MRLYEEELYFDDVQRYFEDVQRYFEDVQRERARLIAKLCEERAAAHDSRGLFFLNVEDDRLWCRVEWDRCQRWLDVAQRIRAKYL